MDLTPIPIVDNHCHSLLREQPQTVQTWNKFFTESYFPEIARDHVEHTIFYQWAQRALAGFLDCEPRPESILEKRNALGLATLTQKINTDANIRAWLVDYGYSTSETFSHAELGSIAGVRIENVLRLEPLIEQLIQESQNFDALFEMFVDTLQDLRSKGLISLKSIIAYRVGLTLSESTRADAAAAFPALKSRATADGKLRIDSKPMLDFLIPLAVEIAAQQEFPIQIHTGFGDPDQDLAKSNSAFLRPIFADKYRGAKIVLLHASYPYARTLGYLASVYPNVYADFGLAIPFVAGDARAVVRELLGLAPATKVLYSSDAFHIPELYWLGAVMGRRVLADVLEEYVKDDLITASAAEEMALKILCENSLRVYEMGAA